MRRVVASLCALPLVLAVLLGTAGMSAPQVPPGTPAPAASPPLGDQYYTAAQLARGLPAAADLPKGYTVAGDSAGSVSDAPLYGSDLCHAGQPSTVGEPVTYVTRTFKHADGAELTI